MASLSKKHRPLWIALLFGLAFWVVDSLIDSFVFNKGTFTDLLLFGLYPGGFELYYRLFFIVCLAACTAVIAQLLATRKDSEDTLKNAMANVEIERQKLRHLYDNSPDAIVVMDTDKNILYANRKTESIVGKPTAEICGKQCFTSVIGADKECDGCKFDEAIRSKLPQTNIKHEITVSGKHNWLEQRWYPVLDAEGRVESVVEIARDMTDIKNAEESVRKSEKKLRDITAALGEGVYVLNKNCELIFMNPEAEKLLGWRETDLLGKNVHDIFHFQKADRGPLPGNECPVISVLSSGRPRFAEDDVFTRKDGTMLPVSYISTPVIENGQIVGAVTAFRDITLSKEMEREMLRTRNLESIGVLAGGIAHDFNNLLTGIMSCIALALESTDKDNELYEILKMAQGASLQARDLTKQLFAFSQAGDEDKRRAALSDILKNSTAFAMTGSNIKPEFDIPEDLWPVEIDTVRISEVVYNLAINAREAMPEGGILSVRAENLHLGTSGNLPLREGNYVKASISDQGAGISKENMEKIFGPYFTTKKLGTQKGVGLGLAICYTILKNHEGHITVESEQGKGSTFTIYLPAAAPETPTVAPPISETPVPKTGRVLLMDDEEIIGQVAAILFKKNGYEIVFVRDGKEAIDEYKKAKESRRPFDMVILDLTVPGGMGGQETIEELIKFDPEIKAVVSSGYSYNTVMVNYKNYGFKAVLHKPYQAAEIAGLVKDVMGRS